MTNCLRKSCSISLLHLFFVKVYLFVGVLFIPRPKGSGDIAMSLASVHPSVNIFVSAR